jgi:glycosyltransferase involved in cell wall biosynthesis
MSNKNSGVGSYINFLLTELVKLDLPYDINLFGEEFNKEIDTIKIKGIKKRILQGFWKYLSFPKLEFITGEVDLFHFTNGTIVPNKANKNIITIHDLSFLKYPETIESKNLSFLKKMMPISLKRADHIITVSENTKKDVIENYNIEDSKITVVYNGLDYEFKEKSSLAMQAKVKQKYNLKNNFLLSVSTIEPRKNFSTLIEAYLKLNKEVKEKTDLIICGGEGWSGEKSKLENLIQKYNLNSNVKLLGFVSRKELRAIYDLAKIYIHTSFYEGFGLSMIEAMEANLPIIASNISCHPEICEDAALYFDVLDSQDLSYKIELLLIDENRRNKFINSGKNRVKNFSWSKAAEKTAEIYKNTLLGY